MKLKFLCLLAALVGVSVQQCTIQRFEDVTTIDILQTSESTSASFTINRTIYNCLSTSQTIGVYNSMSVSILYIRSDIPNQLRDIRYNMVCFNGNWLRSREESTAFMSSDTRRNCSACTNASVNDYHCTSCDSSCTGLNQCYGAGADQCCSYNDDGNCVADCGMNREGNSTFHCVCSNFWTGENCTALESVSEVDVNNESITSSGLTLSWMDISMISNFRHYRVFYLPVRGPYGPIMASNRRKRQSVQAGELFMNFNGTTGNLTDLNGAVTYSIQVAAVATFNDDEVIGDRSAPVERTTLEGVPTGPQNLVYTNPEISNGMFNITLIWGRPDPPNGIITQYNVFYITNLQLGDSINQSADDSILSYTWQNLVVRGSYQFSVVAFTSKGPGDAANLLFHIDTIPSGDSSDDSSDDNNGVIIALVTLLVIAIIGLVIFTIIIVFFVVKRKQSRYDVNQSNVRYSDVKQSVCSTSTDSTNTKHVKPSEPEYEAIKRNSEAKMKVDSDVKMDSNPAYHSNVKMDTNPAYHYNVKMDANPAYQATSYVAGIVENVRHDCSYYLCFPKYNKLPK